MEYRHVCGLVAVALCGLCAEEVVVVFLPASWNGLAPLLECQQYGVQMHSLNDEDLSYLDRRSSTMVHGVLLAYSGSEVITTINDPDC